MRSFVSVFKTETWVSSDEQAISLGLCKEKATLRILSKWRPWKRIDGAVKFLASNTEITPSSSPNNKSIL